MVLPASLPLAAQERDQRLRTAIEGGREDLAGYAYRRVTKALVRFGGPGQLQTSLARHATSWSDQAAKATNGSYALIRSGVDLGLFQPD